MLKRIFCLFVLFTLTGGCIYVNEPKPEIVYDYSREVFEPSPAPAEVEYENYEDVSSEWLPPLYFEKGWTAIIIHHSDTETGNAAIFDRYHRESKNWQGVGYDFVIGNGSDSGDGQVEVTFRWRQQKTGAHTGGTAENWANREGIGICLVGNFNRYSPSERQMASLIRLVRFLQSRYDIRGSRVYGHGDTPGARVTDCPGRNFPMARLVGEILY